MSTASGSRMTRAVSSYVAGVVLCGLTATGFLLALYPLPEVWTLLLCAVMFLVGEVVAFETPTGKGNVTMAAMMHLAMVALFPPSTVVVAVWMSRLPAELLFQRHAWYKSVFNAGQIALAVAGAAVVYGLVGPGPVSLDRSTILWVLPALAAATVVYYVLNHGLVSGVIALYTGSSYRSTWRENFGSRAQVVTSGAVFLTAPIATIVYQTVGAPGLLVFTIPMLLLRDACRRYFALERAQQALIGSERLAAKGEMAASVAHELNNYLAVLNGNLQIVRMRGAAMEPAVREAKMEKALEQVKNMAALAKGLMDFTQLGSRFVATDVRRLVEDAVDFLRPQNRFDATPLSVDCDLRLGMVVLDPAQMQQVLMNLLNNAADAMRDAGTPDRAIWVTVGLRAAEEKLEITVADSGPGVPRELWTRIFEPGFTTKHDGHGFGLSTVYRIVQNHGGTMTVENSAINGALFRILLPLRTETPRALAA